MAYSILPTLSPGNDFTHTIHNQNRDNFIAAVPDIFTTAGDLAVATASKVAARQAIGTTGQALTVDTSLTNKIKWATLVAPRFARYKRTTAQACADNTVVIVDFATVDYDPNSCVTTGAAWKFTVPAGFGGFYLVCAAVHFALSTNWTQGERAEIRLYKNGAHYSVLHSQYAKADAASGVGQMPSGTDVIQLADGDYIDIRAFQNSDASINISGGDMTHVAIMRLYS